MKPAISPIPYSDDVETVPADETAEVQQIANSVQELLERDAVKHRKFRADVHVKTHGYANGELIISSDLPEELAQGLFSQSATYPVVARFSNSASFPKPDAVPDGRGFSIKVSNVREELLDDNDQQSPTQDFVMINHPVFFAANVKDFLRLQTVREEMRSNPLKAAEALTGGDLNPLHWHWRELMEIAEVAGKVPVHPAHNTYYSMSPIRYGNYVAKVRAQPIVDRNGSWLKMLARLATERDAMRLALEETLNSEAIMFEFQVQLRTSRQSMPVEDATIEWPESESPYRTVGYLNFKPQDIKPLRHQEDYRHLGFSVWNCLAAHRPLGGINRIRRVVYPMSANWRRQA